jgi:2'-5' RNA ligase
MDAIVALLDEATNRDFESLWEELRSVGLAHVADQVAIPHVSFHVAEEYDQGRVEESLWGFARKHSPLQINTAGLGIFTGEYLSLYASVVRTEVLSNYHRILWPMLDRASSGVVQYYHPEHWMPHITLAHGDVAAESLAAAVKRFAARSFVWRIQIDAIGWICETNGVHECRFSVPLGG